MSNENKNDWGENKVIALVLLGMCGAGAIGIIAVTVAAIMTKSC